VPIFTEQLERGDKREAFKLASTMIFMVALILGALTALFILLAPVVMEIFAPGYEGELLDLTIALSQLLFPILVLLGLTGMVVGVLNSYDRFGAFAISPLFWNIAIIAVLVGLAPAFPEGDEIYAYAIGVLVGTVVQLAIPAFDLRNTPFRLRPVFDWRNPAVRRVLLLMLPVTISLGLINFNFQINSLFGTLIEDPTVAERAPAAIDKAFRIYMLPQGIFSVAVATVLFPTLARYAARREYGDLRRTMANGMRQIVFLLVPAAAAILVLSEPMVRLVYERGEFDASQTELVATALFWYALSLPFNGLFLLLARTFFSLQRPWLPTSISLLNLLVTAFVALALYREFEVAGIVASTVIATAASVVAQMLLLRQELGGLELPGLGSTAARVAFASALLAGISYLVWWGLDEALGRGLGGQIVSMTAALAAGAAAYAAAVYAMRVPEAGQIMRLLPGRRARGRETK
jgi:putative peptidoglycan lipid II flippase